MRLTRSNLAIDPKIRILFGGDSLTADQSKLIISITQVSVLTRLLNREIPAPE